MRIATLTQGDTSNPVYARLLDGKTAEAYADGDALQAGDYLVVDAVSTAAADISRAFSALDAGATVLLLDPTAAHKQALAQRTGFHSHGDSRGYAVTRRTSGSGQVSFYLSEVGDTTAPATSVSQGGQANTEGKQETYPAQVAFENEPQTTPMSEEAVEQFFKSLAVENASAATEDSTPSGMVAYNWYYSVTHSFSASGSQNSGTGLGPPPTKTISTNLSYVFQGALNNAAQSGAFQYLGVQESGIFQNNGMSNTSDTNFGWTLGAICPTINQPSVLNWYQSSPSNTNDVTQVTTGSSVTVGFNASNTGGSANASYTYSNSSTQNITDWYITQQTASSWVYGQNTPFDGNTTDGGTIADCINWYSGHINTSSFPTISTTSLQFAVDAVWRTSSVINSAQTISISNLMRVDYIMVKTFLGLGSQWADWWYSSTPTDTFTIDMSVLT